jgi:hypothetical protein
MLSLIPDITDTHMMFNFDPEHVRSFVEHIHVRSADALILGAHLSFLPEDRSRTASADQMQARSCSGQEFERPLAVASYLII